MGKQFVIATKDVPPAVQNGLTEFIKAKNWEFWHWFDNLWLLADVQDSYTAKSLREELLTIVPHGSIVVFDMNPRTTRTYWGNAAKESWDWMAKYWGSAG